ncbi:nuclear transport factor 2 family protein [Streptomyces canus]|uniref:nuclear transport factor 2 family protein n=1 Tax=Streptomyces aurantiacus group TaxID=2838335 RepID=UPI0005248F49|nr:MULTISPECIES: nuclear transport factor 2 family protein [Streptomyces]MCX5254843.1 nuclear transport factor 2 family protein [Streptomyces canus]
MKPTNEDTVEISRALALWAHIMDDHELDRLGECLTEDAVWDGSVFGGDPVVGLDAIATFMNAPGHAKAHHTTNIVVSEGPGDEVRARSKGLSLLEGGGVASVVYADDLRRTDDGWRISRRVIHLTWPHRF